jgi:small subunit ribosomal protein S17
MSKRVLQGVVVSDKMQKTVVVQVERRVMHSLYHKYLRKYKKYSAHDAEGACRMGDVVEIQECPPISKTKKWEVISRKETQSNGANESTASAQEI